MPNAYGRLPHTHDPRDYRAQAPAAPYTGGFVNLEIGFEPVWDQGQLGSCVSHATCAAVMFALLKQGVAAADPSRLFHYYAARLRAGLDVSQDTGMEVRDGLASAAKDGVAPAADWAYDIAKFAERPPARAWVDAVTEEATVYGAVAPAAIDNCIADGHPVVIGFDVFASFESQRTADTGVMPVPDTHEENVGGHAVVLCSTPKDGIDIRGGIPGVRYRRARNSWGAGWGDHGYFWFPVDAMNHASDFWQVTTVSAPVPPVPPPGPDSSSARFAAVLRRDNWVGRRHVGENADVAHAALQWLTAQGL